MDLSTLFTPEALLSLLMLILLEIILGVDNIVFISITTDRLPIEKQHIGRKLGLFVALFSRILFLSFASYLVHLTSTIFTINIGDYIKDMSVKDIVLLVGGVYLVYKGIKEITDLCLHREEQNNSKENKMISLKQAVFTIMVMDIVFSIDSVITAVGLADQLVVMIAAVIIAVMFMMAFIDPVSNFINKNLEIKILAIIFIILIGALLTFESLGLTLHKELFGMELEKLMVYTVMFVCIIFEASQIFISTKLKTNMK